jgi:hypothetical protein
MTSAKLANVELRLGSSVDLNVDFLDQAENDSNVMECNVGS